MKAILLLAVLAGQEVRITYGNWAACLRYDDWTVQETVRHQRPDEWASLMRSLVLDGSCFLTRAQSRVMVAGEDSTGHAVYITDGKISWWLSSESLVP